MLTQPHEHALWTLQLDSMEVPFARAARVLVVLHISELGESRMEGEEKPG